MISRKWAMPNSNTFEIKPIKELLEKYLYGVVVDPFARDSKYGTITNDLNPATSAQYHLPAEEFVKIIDVKADCVLFDPPYSPRQITECYASIGKKCTTEDTQSGRLYKSVKDGLNEMLKIGGIAISFGWNSSGFGIKRNFKILEILMVCHGGAHNDTIVVVEEKNA